MIQNSHVNGGDQLLSHHLRGKADDHMDGSMPGVNDGQDANDQIGIQGAFTAEIMMQVGASAMG